MVPARRPSLAVVTAVLLVSGCAAEHSTSDHGQSADDHDGAASEHDTGAMAGMPGMPDVSAPPETADWNAADATYLSMMVAHHSQALDMAELAAERASDPAVRRLAAGIDAGQGREITVMATWLVGHGQPEPTVESVAAMGDTGMPGMLTSEQLDDLAETTGAAFDRRFLESMVQHHQGAVSMAEQVLGSGEDVRVTEMATDVIVTQNAEVERMRELLEQLP